MKPLSLMLALLILAGCGGGGTTTSAHLLQGNGFHFQAPQSWLEIRKGNSVAATRGSVDRVEVLRFRLQKPFRPELFGAASRELDGVIARIASQLKGKVARRSTVQVSGRRARRYQVDYGGDRTEEIAFVLDGRTEYQLLCRRRRSEPSLPCSDLFSSFALLPPAKR